MPIHVGTDAPDFDLPSSELENDKPGKKIRLSDFRGKQNVVLAFYPLDFSPVCSKEHQCFVEDFSAFAGTGAAVLGISVDSAWAHFSFAKKMGLTYPLLADFHPKGAYAKQLGLYLEDRGFSARATVIVDKSGKVAYVKVQPTAEARDNAEILEVLRKLA